MSRIGKKPIPLPEKVEVRVESGVVTVKGPLGELKRTLHPAVAVEVVDRDITVRPLDESRLAQGLWGLTRTLIANMVHGVHTGFTRELDIVGVGYKAELQGANLKLALGFSHPVVFEPPEGIKFEVPAPQAIVVRGGDKEIVGLIASKIRALRPPEPYKGKGIKYRTEKVRRKVRKSALAGGKG